MNYIKYCIPLLMLCSCKGKVETIKPIVQAISESVYASGVVKAQNQYDVYSPVSGIVSQVLVAEGDTVKKGQLLLIISNQIQKLNRDNAILNQQFTDVNANQGKLNEALSNIQLTKNKMLNDSVLNVRQKNLWDQKIGSKVEFEQREIAFQNTKNAYLSSIIRYKDLKRQVNFTAAQAKKSLQLTNSLENDFKIRSEVDGIVYAFTKSKGETVNPQTAIGVIGGITDFELEMEVDEYDILKIRKGMKVYLNLDSYKGKVFEAEIVKINPLMNLRTKTFKVEGRFVSAPEVLYPNISFEANILLQSKDKAMLIPRNFLLNDSNVVNKKGELIKVVTGLKDFQKIEILSGISANDELQKPSNAN